MPPFSPGANAVTKTRRSLAGAGVGAAVTDTAARTYARDRATPSFRPHMLDSFGEGRHQPRFFRSRKTTHDGLPTEVYWPVKARPPVLRSTRKTVTLSARWLQQ